MNSSTIKLKKFLTNKNTVAVVCALIGVLLLFFAYNWRVKQATDPRKTPFAKVDIQPRTKITEDMIDYRMVPSSAIDENTVTDSKKIIGMYSNVNTMIPAGSLFYDSVLVEDKQRADYYMDQVPKDYVLYYLNIDMKSSFSNSMLPGRYIDIYLQTESAGDTELDENSTTVVEGGKIMVARFLHNVKILAVKTSGGANVFEDSDNAGSPSQLIVALPEQQHLLLRAASQLGSLNSAYNVSVIPVPNATEDENNKDMYKPEIVNEAWKEYILARVEDIDPSLFDDIKENENKAKTGVDKK